jgi:hypothetical protein
MLDMDRFTKLATFLAGVFIIITYAGLRLTYGQFYSAFGLSPEDVGWNRDLLLQSLAGPAFIAFYSRWFIAILAAVLIIGVVTIAVIEIRARQREINMLNGRTAAVAARYRRVFNRKRYQRLLKRSIVLLVSGLLLAYLAGLVDLYVQGRKVVNEKWFDVAIEGQSFASIRWPGSAKGRRFPFLGIKALPVSLAPKEGAKLPAPLILNSECFLYLGETNSRIVLYDVRLQRIIKEDSDNLIITIRPNTYADRLPPTCPRTSTAQAKITAKGVVQSDLTKSGLRASISGAVTAKTDAHGRYSVKVPEGSQTLLISAPGYEPVRIKVTEAPRTITLHANPATNLRQQIAWSSQQRYGKLWSLVHPDAHHYITRSAFIQNARLRERRGYAFVTVTVRDVQYVTWTLPKCKFAAFGPKTYRHAAAIRAVIHQATPKGGLDNVPTITHLVRRGNGMWASFPVEGCALPLGGDRW